MTRAGKRGPGPARPGRRALFHALALVCLSAFSSSGAAQDFGYEGPRFVGAGAAPTESKPESKLWFHAGAWWGSLWSTPGQAFHVHRLDQRTHVWTDTGVPIEFRSQSKSDVLADGNRLYVGSHRFSSDGGESGYPILMLRYRYDERTESYALDSGFPVTIGSSSTESLGIGKDSSGAVWAAWVQGRRIFTSHSVSGDERIWTAPALLPGSTSDVTYDEVCALIHFGGNRMGVMWSDQALNLFRFAVHEDGAPDDVWSLETPLAGESDDHIHLATDARGRVFAVVKNVENEIKLLVRDAGVWTSFLVSTGIDRFTRPIVLLDEEHRRIHVFASGQDNGLIHEKTSSLDDIAFAPGTGRVVIQDASLPLVNNATSTKQNVDSSTGLVVLVAHESTEAYWHHSVAPAALLVSSFSAAPLSGRAPLVVRFADTSTGTPTSWSWDFGDGASSIEKDPEHVYTASGNFSVRLTVHGRDGADDETWNELVTVAPALPTRSFLALADARVNEASPAANAGKATELQVRSSPGASYASYLRFDLSALSAPAASAKLRLFCTDGSTVGGVAFATTNVWSETTLTWNNRPAARSAQIAALGSVTANTWVELDVSAAVGVPGIVSFLLTSTSSNSANYSSREGAQPPELVVELAQAERTVANFTANPTAGAAPLAVVFGDLSSSATSWSWDFGDGTRSSVRNPTHVYTSPGSFTVTLAVTGPGGSDVETKVGLVTVNASPALERLRPVADARVSEAGPNANAGSAAALRAQAGRGSAHQSYLRFDLSGASGPVTSAKLRLYCTDASPVGGALFLTPSSWAEKTITWKNKPAASGAQIATLGAVASGAWVEVDVTAAVTGAGPVSFVLTSSSSDSATYSSREGPRPPELLVRRGTP